MEPGASLGGGRYVVKGLLGEGSQGATYEATDTTTGKSVAIKRFDVRGARSWKDVELAERETRVLSTMDHPLVPRYLGHFEDGGALYLVMEKVEGETLEAIRKREGPLPEAEVRRFLACADRALTYLHGRGSPVVHRDVKPSNVVRRADGSYVFVDFGAVAESLFRKGGSTIVGTLGYMAPEQIQGRALPASDVYAVGATALAALTGAEPETMPHRGLRVDVRSVLGGRVSPELVASLERMLEPDPDVRAGSIGAALEGVAASVASVPPPPAPPARSGRRGKGADRPPRTPEQVFARSSIGLLWTLWGLGWVVVPMVLGKVLDVPEGIPIVMFGWMAMIFVAMWHKGAVLRAAYRWWEGERASSPTRDVQPEGRQRVEVTGVQQPQVRVHTSELGPDEVVAGTEVQSADEGAGRRSAR